MKSLPIDEMKEILTIYFCKIILVWFGLVCLGKCVADALAGTKQETLTVPTRGQGADLHTGPCPGWGDQPLSVGSVKAIRIPMRFFGYTQSVEIRTYHNLVGGVGEGKQGSGGLRGEQQ